MALLIALAAGLSSAVAADPDFERLAGAARDAPQDLRAGNELRRACRERKHFDTCIDFFDELAKKYPTSRAAHYQAALAYVDNLPGHSLIVQARLSTHSMEHATAVLENNPDDWLSLYIRGLNNLYWPAWYRRTRDAIRDLTRCIEITEAMPAEKRREYMTLPYVALGDAYAKQDDYTRARATWERGKLVHPTTLLEERLRLLPSELAKEVDTIRSREIPVDTDLEFFLPEYTERT